MFCCLEHGVVCGLCLQEDECKWIKNKIHWIFLHTLYIESTGSERIWMKPAMSYWVFYTIYMYAIRPARRIVVRIRIFTAYLLTCKSHTEYLLIWDHQPQIISLDDFFFSPRNSFMIFVLCSCNIYGVQKSHKRDTRDELHKIEHWMNVRLNIYNREREKKKRFYVEIGGQVNWYLCSDRTKNNNIGWSDHQKKKMVGNRLSHENCAF